MIFFFFGQPNKQDSERQILANLLYPFTIPISIIFIYMIIYLYNQQIHLNLKKQNKKNCKSNCLRRRKQHQLALPLPIKKTHFPSLTKHPKTHLNYCRYILYISLSLRFKPIYKTKFQTKTMNCLQLWPEPIVRVQSLAESGIRKLPHRYIKPVYERPQTRVNSQDDSINIPVISLEDLFTGDETLREATLAAISSACREWGFFQVVNHGISPELMKQARETWREFFGHPAEEKQRYANSPSTYEGYGSRLGVEKGALLDWSDYFFLHFLPSSLRNPDKWPSLPSSCRFYFSPSLLKNVLYIYIY